MGDDSAQFRKAKQGEGIIVRADLAIAERADKYSDAMPVRAIGKLSELADQPPLVAASLTTVIVGYVWQRPSILRLGLRMLASHGLATALKSLVKNNVDRSRPEKTADEGEHEARPGHSDEGGKRSFPSGHSAGAFAVAGAIARERPSAAPYAYPAAIVASGIQIPRKAHFTSDVLVGVAIGIVAELVIDRVSRRWV